MVLKKIPVRKVREGMPIIDLYSKRQRRLRGDYPDVYTYDKIPQTLREQVVHIWKDAIGNPENSGKALEAFEAMDSLLSREYGRSSLTEGQGNTYYSLLRFFLSSEDTERVLDVIDLSFKIINTIIREDSFSYNNKIGAEDAIEELNIRFREHGVGYKFEAGRLLRVDSELIHTEAVKPALNLLSGIEYKGANEEFLMAHEHYRQGRYKECLNECLKAFESVMKAICVKRGWAYSSTDTVSKLINICFDKGLIPGFLQSEFSGLRTSLESGVPTVRNKMSGHGQGTQPIRVPDYLAGYLLHLTASNIVLLVEAEKQLP
jgi:hypothetical protein